VLWQTEQKTFISRGVKEARRKVGKQLDRLIEGAAGERKK
jgi:hypothetical protein